MSGLRLGVLVSGSGSNLQSIIDACEKGILESKVVCVLSNKEAAYGLTRAENHGVPAFYMNPKEKDYDEKVLTCLETHEVDLVVLAGYLKIVPQIMIEAFKKRIINIHPSLLPKYGGKGYYGIHVHEAVLQHKEEESGATVHYVDCGIDTGAILLQGKVPVKADDTPETLQKRILDEVEHQILVKAIRKLEQEGLA